MIRAGHDLSGAENTLTMANFGCEQVPLPGDRMITGGS
jgi:hypothetical protein